MLDVLRGCLSERVTGVWTPRSDSKIKRDMHLATSAVLVLFASNICTGFCAKANRQRLVGVSCGPLIVARRLAQEVGQGRNVIDRVGVK